MIGRIDSYVVGLAYCNLSESTYKRISNEEKLELRRDPSNPHDQYAVAVYLADIRIGFISKDQSKAVSEAIKNGSSASVTLRQKEQIKHAAKSFPVTIKIENKLLTHVNSPKIASGKVAGIYRIESSSTGYCYIGQSVNVNERISAHWKSLALGVHTNRGLQELWDKTPNNDFVAKLIKEAPAGLSDLDRQRWLGDQEARYINMAKETKLCVNSLQGGLVLTPSIRAQESPADAEKRRIHNEEIMRKRPEIQLKLSEIDSKLKSKQEKLSAHNSESQNLRGILNENGLWSVLTGSFTRENRKNTEKKIFALNIMIKNIQNEINALENQRNELIEHLGTLKKKSYQPS